MPVVFEGQQKAGRTPEAELSSCFGGNAGCSEVQQVGEQQARADVAQQEP